VAQPQQTEVPAVPGVWPWVRLLANLFTCGRGTANVNVAFVACCPEVPCNVSKACPTSEMLGNQPDLAWPPEDEVRWPASADRSATSTWGVAMGQAACQPSYLLHCLLTSMSHLLPVAQMCQVTLACLSSQYAGWQTA